VAIRDPRAQLFDAAERVLLRDGPAALTSRAVTDEAGVAKGVLHRHFAGFEEFLTELALDRISRVNARADALLATAGTGTVAGNLAAALPALFTPPLLAMVRLVFARDELRARLRAATGSRIPLMSECVALAARYLEAERALGRIAPGTDISTAAPMLVSAVHLLFTDAGGHPGEAAITRVVAAALPGAGNPATLALHGALRRLALPAARTLGSAAVNAIGTRLAATAAAYDAVAARYARFARGELGGLPLDRAFLGAFAEHVGARAGGPVADLGCGEGRIGAHLAGLGLDVIGLDLSHALAAIARDRHPVLRFAVASMHALPLADGSLGGIVSWYSLIHAAPSDVPSYLAAFSRALRPGGHVLAAFFEAAGEQVTPFDHKVTPAYRWPLNELARLAAAAGLAEVGRMSREPRDGERFRRGHLLMRRRRAAGA
jgi:AcrR family transcriptional regulator/ubiquinone/menaquinone biosynthesis C-methylase UbiE